MEIIVGKMSGFCYGVKRAVEGSNEEMSKNKDKKIYCLGELVHNKQVIEELESKGIDFIEDIEDVKEQNSKVIIRAHGVDKKVYQEAQEKKLDIIDFTCPNVLKVHEIAKEYKEKGYYIFVIGIENHPEILGTLSYCGINSYLISSENDIEKAIEHLKKSNIKKLLIISQTTYSTKSFKNIVEILQQKLPKEIELVIKNTICLATETRQNETKELSKKVDMMIIIGGKNSSNTKKLYEIAKENCENTICIETKEDITELPKEGIIGIMAGASTPQKSIDEVVKLMVCTTK